MLLLNKLKIFSEIQLMKFDEKNIIFFVDKSNRYDEDKKVVIY